MFKQVIKLYIILLFTLFYVMGMDGLSSSLMMCEDFCSEFCELKEDEELELCLNSCMKYCIASKD